MDGTGELRAKFEAIDRKKSSGAPLKRYAAFGRDVGGVFGGECGGGDSEHVGAVAEAARGDDKAGVAMERDGQRFKVVDAYCNIRFIGERNGVNTLAWDFMQRQSPNGCKYISRPTR